MSQKLLAGIVLTSVLVLAAAAARPHGVVGEAAVGKAPVALTNPAEEVTFSGCGVLAHGPQACLNFIADTGEAWLLENNGGFGVGDYVYVVGRIVEDSTICGPYVGPAIEDNTIAACFSGCGVLARGPQTCLVLQTDSGESYPVENTGEFWLGDYVYVSGPINEESQQCFPLITPGIENNTISACFSGCGVLARGPQTCLILHADSGEAYPVDNTGGFWEGDYVYVSGPINEESLQCFPLIMPGIEDNEIAPCD